MMGIPNMVLMGPHNLYKINTDFVHEKGTLLEKQPPLGQAISR